MLVTRILRARWLIRGAAGLILFFAWASADTGAAPLPDDLNLDRTLEAGIWNEPVPNPHANLSCDQCHIGRETSYEFAKRFGLSMPLLTEGDHPGLLCDSCHKEGSCYHPANIQIRRLVDPVLRAGIFPVEVLFEGCVKITCSTCHVVHFPHTEHRLLRGFPVDPKVGGGVFRTRLDFCRACHGNEVLNLSGHGATRGDQSCDLCHLERDISGRVGDLRSVMNRRCAICHPTGNGRREHFLEFNPFPDFKREELARYEITLLRGNFTCATCHQHHVENAKKLVLRPAFVNLVSKSLRINPHQTTGFCQNCHPIRPPPPGTPGAVAPLLEIDITRLCRGCHTKKNSLQMHHPLLAPTTRVGVPEGWPLRWDGTMGCHTCHLAGHAPQDPTNPKWLRGAPYGRRNEICFRCHREEDYRGRNIHREVADFGGCEFCHVVKERSVLRPEGKIGDLLAEPNLLCLPCHSPYPHPASANHTLKPRAQSFLLIDEKKMPLTQGKVTCHSCHDSHSRDTGNMLLRITHRGSICAGCHPF